MEDILDTELTAEKKAELIKQFDEYLEAIEDRITAETWAILARMPKIA
jgi:hypothetical protein